MVKNLIENLKSKIFESYAGTKQPAKDDIVSHNCEQCQEMRKDFAGIKWQEVNDELLERNYDKIPLFSPQAFVYYLPAFLVYTLNNFDSHSVIGEFTIYALTPDKKWNQDEESLSYWTEKFSFFTDEKMNAVYDFLELSKQNPVYEYEFDSISKKVFDRLKSIKAAN